MRVISYVLAAALLFAGCTNAQPKEPGPSAKPSPTATVPSMPAAAQENTVAGAVAFVKHYIAVFNYASNTGDVKELQKLSDPGCEACKSYLDTIKSSHSDGGEIDGFGWKVTDIQAGSSNVLELSIRSKGYRTKDHSGASWTQVLSAEYQIGMRISFRQDEWIATELLLPSKDDA